MLQVDPLAPPPSVSMRVQSGQQTEAGREGIILRALDGRVIPGLDALRVIAISLVVSFHAGGAKIDGPMGVTIFFVLSGFLITSILLKETRRTGTISLREFYIRRAFRIFPAFYVCWVLTTVMMLVCHERVIWKQAAASFFYVSDYARAFLSLKQQETFHMGVSWSLAIEEQFYLLWPVALLWIARKRKSAPAVVGGAILCVWLWRAVLMCSFGVPWTYTYNAFDTRCDALLVGCWLATVLYGKSAPVRRVLAGLTSSLWVMVFPLAALLVASYIDAVGSKSLAILLINFSLQPIFIGMVLVQWVYLGATSWRFLEHRAIKLVARLSYSIYLYHPLVFGLRRYVPLQHGKWIVAMPIIIALSATSYYLIERPLLRIRDRGRKTSALMDDGLQHFSA